MSEEGSYFFRVQLSCCVMVHRRSDQEDRNEWQSCHVHWCRLLSSIYFKT